MGPYTKNYMTQQWQGNLVDVPAKNIYYATIAVADGRITGITPDGPARNNEPFILPGFVDAHVHIESSMLVPSQFAKLAVVHGTVATVSDPHEIANVCGVTGVEYMITEGATVPFKFYFGAPSCVPATHFETAGAVIDSIEIESLLQRKEILYLAEMMNFPGVLQSDAEVLKKIAAAKRWNKPVDGHAPGLMGEAAQQYVAAGISTDHECFTLEEAAEKLQYGMKILIREGSAAKNFEALWPLLSKHPGQVMFCSDDKHPDSLVSGHINTLCARAVAKGVAVFDVLQAACITPVQHYNLKVGLLRQADFADFILVKDLQHFEVLETIIDGVSVAKNGASLIKTTTPSLINNFRASAVKAADFAMPYNGAATISVIEALDGQLITNKILMGPKVDGNFIVTDVAADVLKIVVVNRYQNSRPAVAFIKNFGLQRGAIASSVAHDSHNIVAVGVDDESIAEGVNLIIEAKGGVSLVNGDAQQLLPLPVAGLMSAEDGYAVAKGYEAIDSAAKNLGSTLAAPYMTLSFMALLVIPHLKLSDKGLFDGDSFSFI